jgi:S1-C subfamily serine protease
MAGAGFELGDIILRVNDQPIRGINSFVDLVSTLQPKQKVSVLALDRPTRSRVPVFVVVR